MSQIEELRALDSSTIVSIISTDEQVKELEERAKKCLEELQLVLEKYNSKIEFRESGKRAVLVPYNDNGFSYVRKTEFEAYHECSNVIELDADEVLLK